MVTAHCVRAPAASTDRRRCQRPSVEASRPGRAAKKITATAPKDSQKPGNITAHGSSSNAASAAHASTTEAGGARALHTAMAATQSMATVRSAGTCMPASRP
ncbi:hypothetical protein D3C72_1477380 [compost metagenome]